MPSFDSVTIIGTLGKDPELKYLPSGTAVCEFSLAVNRQWTDNGGQKKTSVTWIPVVAWGRTAEVICQYLKRGDSFLVNGRHEEDGRAKRHGEKAITAIHPAAEPADGWVDFGVVRVKRFGDTVVVYVPGSLAAQVYGPRPEWFPADEETTTEALDAAYAAHVAEKPVLVWDEETFAFWMTAKFKGGAYVARMENDADYSEAWFAEWYDEFVVVRLASRVSEDEAKAACERHARGGVMAVPVDIEEANRVLSNLGDIMSTTWDQTIQMYLQECINAIHYAAYGDDE